MQATRWVPVVVFSTPDQDVDVYERILSRASMYVRKPAEAKAFEVVSRHLVDYWLTWNEPGRDRMVRYPVNLQSDINES